MTSSKVVFVALICATLSVASAKVALVTGASSGIGLVASKHFAQQGLQVVLTARRLSKLEEAVAEIKAAGGDAVAFALDVTKEADHIAAFAFAKETYGSVDYVFANAGFIGELETPFEEQTAEALMRPMMINVGGMALSLKHAVKSFRENSPPGGTIVFTSSIVAVFASSNYHAGGSSGIPYIITKGATDALVRGMGAYLHEGIRGYGLNPAVYESEMTTRDAADKFGIEVGQMVGGTNPVFDNIHTPFLRKEGLVHLAKVVLAMFDGTTKYEPCDHVISDGDGTWNAQVAYNAITSHTNPKGIPSRDVWLKHMNDYKGEPYDMSTLPQMKKIEL